jgi:hypothetical protein
MTTHYTPALMEEIETLAGQGLTLEQIARCIGIAISTLMMHKKNKVDVMEAIKRGQASGVQKVSNALFDKAVGGDTIAQIFYLKNRSPEEWKDRKEIKQEINQTVSIDTNQLADEVMQSIVKDERTRREEEARIH